MMTTPERLSAPASGSFDGNSRFLGETAVDLAKRFCMIRVPTAGVAGRARVGGGDHFGSRRFGERPRPVEQPERERRERH